MKCLTDNILRTHYYSRPECCETCPLYPADKECHRRVDMTGWVVVFEDGRRGRQRSRIMVDSYYCFDGASIPRWCWSLVGHPFTPAFVRAALLHDALYYTHINPSLTLPARKFADRAFRELLRADGVAWWRRWAMYAAVRVFGRFCWDRPAEVLEYFRLFVRVENAGGDARDPGK